MTLSAQLMSRQGFLFIYAWAQARIDELGIDPLSISGGTSFSFEISLVLAAKEAGPLVGLQISKNVNLEVKD